MASLFDLPMAPTSPDHGVSSMYFAKVEPNQPVRQDSGFGSQRIEFSVNPAVNEWLVPARSYFRLRIKIEGKNGDGSGYVSIGADQGTSNAGQIAKSTYPAYGICGKLFSQASLKVGGNTVNSVSSNLPQIDAMHKRVTLSRSQLETSEGLYQTDRVARTAQFLAQVKAGDGKYVASTALSGEVIWQPPLGFSDVTHAVPASQYIWSFVANPNFQRDAVDGGDVEELTPGTDVKVTVESMVLYACYVRGRDGSDEKYALNMRQITCQALGMASSTSSNLQLRNFDIPADSSALAIAFQNSSSDNKFGGQSLFRVNAAGSLDQQTQLTRWYISYDNSIYPQEQSEQVITATNSFISQRYRDTQAQTGMYFSPGSPQTIDEWLRKTGAFYFVNWPRVQSTATRVQVNADLPVNDATTAFQCLLFSISDQSFLVRTSDGKVRKVEVGE
jgi:hypothetical protein